MRRPLVVPKLGLTMTEGSLVEWLLQPGMRFEAGQTLFIIESEKAGVEVPAEAAGTLLEADAPIGTPLPVGTVIGYWDDGEAGGEAGEGVAAPSPAVATPVAAPTTRLLVTPLARRIA
ncbi:MAG: biotin/lipoyl-containing protein, partial [Geminicoccaceae bacterium]